MGTEDFTEESQELIRHVEKQINDLDAKDKADKKKITALQKDKAALQERIAKTDALFKEIGGQLTIDEARHLILKKLYDIASKELERYLYAEKRMLIHRVENLWNKYAVSSQELEQKRETTLKELNGFLNRLGYLG